MFRIYIYDVLLSHLVMAKKKRKFDLDKPSDVKEILRMLDDSEDEFEEESNQSDENSKYNDIEEREEMSESEDEEKIENTEIEANAGDIPFVPCGY